MRLSNYEQRKLDAEWSEAEDRRLELKARYQEWLKRCAVCDHTRELHELPFVETSHKFTPRQASLSTER